MEQVKFFNDGGRFIAIRSGDCPGEWAGELEGYMRLLMSTGSREHFMKALEAVLYLGRKPDTVAAEALPGTAPIDEALGMAEQEGKAAAARLEAASEAAAVPDPQDRPYTRRLFWRHRMNQGQKKASGVLARMDSLMAAHPGDRDLRKAAGEELGVLMEAILKNPVAHLAAVPRMGAAMMKKGADFAAWAGKADSAQAAAFFRRLAEKLSGAPAGPAPGQAATAAAGPVQAS